MKRILICEDEASIRDFVVLYMKRAGFTVLEAGSGEEAVEKFTASENAGEPVDVALLDVMLPGINGFEVCRLLREKSDTMGIIMLTARTQEAEKVSGLMNGADDYVTKPFSPSELVARVEALYRRLSKTRAADAVTYKEEIVSGEFTLNVRNRTLTKSGEQIDLTQLEFQILEYFFTNPGQTFSRTDILNRVWGEDYYGDDKIVDVNIRRLRMKLEEDASSPRHICTVWGQGYSWNP